MTLIAILFIHFEFFIGFINGVVSEMRVTITKIILIRSLKS